jgi:flagellar basal-body rod modification protein FlgD
LSDSYVPGTTNVWPNYSTQNVQQAARKPTTELGKDEFLKILVTQLQNQDPMQPMEDKDFIAQMAQFSSLEQTMNMAKELHALSQSAGLLAGLIGKQVEWIETNPDGNSATRSGIVEAIVQRDGTPYVRVNGKEIQVSDLTSIANPASDGSGAQDPSSGADGGTGTDSGSGVDAGG